MQRNASKLRGNDDRASAWISEPRDRVASDAEPMRSFRTVSLNCLRGGCHDLCCCHYPRRQPIPEPWARARRSIPKILHAGAVSSQGIHHLLLF
ncbi:hypothetical protein L3X38_014877 [Prunus dulcis]|uniref:Uncharacterized protein n=1 Tax=Prunus dulcis TaxID=3755 RepID=A0AAD4WP17_PRUDU|nr:hypothetical protein L3X38_014877 [Prunus dulcis]